MSFPLIPDVQIPSLTDITPAALQKRKLRLLMMDFDNTMLPYSTNTPSDALLAWIAAMQSSEITLCVVSNSKKQRVPEFCRRYGLDCVTHAKKPFSRGISEALARYGCAPSEAALVGDQIYTDVLGGNCAHVTSILVRPIHLSNIWLKLRHLAEKPFIAAGRRKNRENFTI